MLATCELCKGSGWQQKAGKKKKCPDCGGIAKVELVHVDTENSVIDEDSVEVETTTTVSKSFWQNIKENFVKK
jgi:DnaJ-class molecular chaperone